MIILPDWNSAKLIHFRFDFNITNGRTWMNASNSLSHQYLMRFELSSSAFSAFIRISKLFQLYLWWKWSVESMEVKRERIRREIIKIFDKSFDWFSQNLRQIVMRFLFWVFNSKILEPDEWFSSVENSSKQSNNRFQWMHEICINERWTIFFRVNWIRSVGEFIKCSVFVMNVFVEWMQSDRVHNHLKYIFNFQINFHG